MRRFMLMTSGAEAIRTTPEEQSDDRSEPRDELFGVLREAECTGFGDTTLRVTISASDQDDPTGESLS